MKLKELQKKIKIKKNEVNNVYKALEFENMQLKEKK